MSDPVEELGSVVQAAVGCPSCAEQFAIGVVIMPDEEDGYTAAILNPVGVETMEGLLSDYVGKRYTKKLLEQAGPK